MLITLSLVAIMAKLYQQAADRVKEEEAKKNAQVREEEEAAKNRILKWWFRQQNKLIFLKLANVGFLMRDYVKANKEPGAFHPKLKEEPSCKLDVVQVNANPIQRLKMMNPRRNADEFCTLLQQIGWEITVTQRAFNKKERLYTSPPPTSVKFRSMTAVQKFLE
jgi:hypothetical protein